MSKSTLELWVGLFVLIGIVCIGYLTIKLGKMELMGDNYYTVNARFDSVTGLRVGAEVVISGVEIGAVKNISLDPKSQAAMVELKIQNGVTLSDDVIAAVKTSGLIGDKYISLSPGGSDVAIKPGGTILETESAIDIEELISKYVFGGV